MRLRQVSSIIAIALFALLPSQSVTAVTPTLVMIYGGGLQNPLYVEAGARQSLSFLWGISRNGLTPEAWVVTGRRSVMPENLGGRPYLRFAVFWRHDRWATYLRQPDLLNQLKPEDASQHGRLYLPRGGQPAAVVATPPLMGSEHGVPIPETLDGFTDGWTLNNGDVSAAKRLGVPGL
jgi:hypothetical protein